MKIMDKLITVCAKYSFGAGGTGSHSTDVDYETAQLMIKSDFITIDGRHFKVKAVEVTDKKEINFFVDEIPKTSDEKELSISEIEHYFS